MEKIETKTKHVEGRTHHFYCYNCDTYIGSSEEYDDGWYEELGEFELQMYTPLGWWKMHKCFCRKCREDFLEKFYVSLKNMGFELDKY